MSEEQSAEKKSRKVQQRTLETRAAIIRAALKEFADVGFDGASTRGIADRAGVKHTLISHHFGTKDDLWKATASYAYGLYRDRFAKRQSGLQGVEETALLRLLLREFILFSAEVPEFHRFMIQASQSGDERLQWLIDTHLGPGGDNESPLLVAAQKAGLFPEGDLIHLRYLFIGAATTIFTVGNEFERITGQNPTDNDFIERHIDLVMKIFIREP